MNSQPEDILPMKERGIIIVEGVDSGSAICRSLAEFEGTGRSVVYAGGDYATTESESGLVFMPRTKFKLTNPYRNDMAAVEDHAYNIKIQKQIKQAKKHIATCAKNRAKRKSKKKHR